MPKPTWNTKFPADMTLAELGEAKEFVARRRAELNAEIESYAAPRRESLDKLKQAETLIELEVASRFSLQATTGATTVLQWPAEFIGSEAGK